VQELDVAPEAEQCQKVRLVRCIVPAARKIHQSMSFGAELCSPAY